MSLTELSTGKGSTYLDIQGKLEHPFEINELCKEWVIEFLAENRYDQEALRITDCGTKAVSLKCLNGHQKIVRITCHKEYCPRCGRTGSLAHRKRYLRAMDRLIWSDVLGYMVFTLPREVSDAMPSKEQLSKIEKEAVRIVQGNFSTPGCMVRTHLMGEEIEHLHVHVNVLFPITDTNGKGAVDLTTLHNITQHWTTFVNMIFGLNHETTNTFYKFATSKVKMRHKVKYVTRPVVTPTKFLSLSGEAKRWYLSLVGWHNTRWYGQLANCKYKEYLKSKGLNIIANQESDIALAKKCPVCGGRFKPQGLVYTDDIARTQFRQLDADVWVDLEIFAVLKSRASP